MCQRRPATSRDDAGAQDVANGSRSATLAGTLGSELECIPEVREAAYGHNQRRRGDRAEPDDEPRTAEEVGSS
jgi:hypothetical protein